jgi:hypothetical protein
MRLTALTSLAILLGAGYAFAADTDAGTAGRPSAVLTGSECLAAWHAAAGDELTRFHRGKDSLSPANARGSVTNFEQADTDRDGKISQVEFMNACKLGLVNANAASHQHSGS